MAIFRLPEEPLFPPPDLAESDGPMAGLLAVGGDLEPERLLAAYRAGIFPWYSEGEPILWWSPHPRMTLDPAAIHLPRSLKKYLRRGRHRFTLDRDFAGVIRGCAQARAHSGTWITPEMEAAYNRLHQLGCAHSCEAWRLDAAPSGPRLVGGVYGVAIGGAFFGESMFYHEPDASKGALAVLAQRLVRRGFTLFDCQMNTAHLARFGAREISRADFLERLRTALVHANPPGSWRSEDFEVWRDPNCGPSASPDAEFHPGLDPERGADSDSPTEGTPP